MDLRSSEESRALGQSVRLVLEDTVTTELLRYAGNQPGGPELRTCWKTVAETGVLSALVPESAGGLGLDLGTVVDSFDLFGYYGAPLPYIETICITAPGLATSESALLDGLLQGDIVATATMSASNVVGYTDMSDYVIVGDGLKSEMKALLCEGPPHSESDGTTTIDEGRAVRYVQVPDAAVPIDLVARSWDRAAVASASALAGLARRILDMTVGYVAERQQFGRPVGSFQAIKHQLADVRAQLEQALPLVKAAAWEVDRADGTSSRYVSAAKIKSTQIAKDAVKAGIQCHGAMAYTTEYDLQLFAKQIWALSAQWGSAEFHRHQLARQLDIKVGS